MNIYSVNDHYAARTRLELAETLIAERGLDSQSFLALATFGVRCAGHVLDASMAMMDMHLSSDIVHSCDCSDIFTCDCAVSFHATTGRAYRRCEDAEGVYATAMTMLTEAITETTTSESETINA